MPEGPEVFNIAKELTKNIKNKNLNNILFLSGRYKRHGPPENFSQFISLLPSSVKSIKTKGKLIYILFDKDIVLSIHLGLEGRFTLNDEKHNNIQFIFDDTNLFFNDFRNFGHICTFTSFSDFKSNKLDLIGPDFLTEKITQKQFISILDKHPNTQIGIFLLKQNIISGIGVYLRSDILYTSKINPYTLIKNISNKKILFKEIKKHIFSKSSDDEQIYQKKKDHLGNEVVSENMNDGRRIHWVPVIQTN